MLKCYNMYKRRDYQHRRRSKIDCIMSSLLLNAKSVGVFEIPLRNDGEIRRKSTLWGQSSKCVRLFKAIQATCWLRVRLSNWQCARRISKALFMFWSGGLGLLRVVIHSGVIVVSRESACFNSPRARLPQHYRLSQAPTVIHNVRYWRQPREANCDRDCRFHSSAVGSGTETATGTRSTTRQGSWLDCMDVCSPAHGFLESKKADELWIGSPGCIALLRL